MKMSTIQSGEDDETSSAFEDDVKPSFPDKNTTPFQDDVETIVTSESRINDQASHVSSSAAQEIVSEVQRGKKRRLGLYVPREPRNFNFAAAEYHRVPDEIVHPYLTELDTEIVRAKQGVRYDASLDKRRRLNDELQTSQVGATIWTANDKARLFNAVAIYGKDDIVSISAALESEISPIQVREYLLLLEDASIEYRRKIGSRKWRLMLLQDQSAAYEIDKDLAWRLEIVARAIEYRRRINEEQEEWRRVGAYWILDVPVSKEVRNAYSRAKLRRRQYLHQKREESEDPARLASEPERIDSLKLFEEYENEEPILSAIPAAKLLNLYNLLQLSSTFFMWRARPIHVDYGPSMRQTAFSDFESLVKSVTRRIVNVVIFQTEITIREKLDRHFRRRVVRPHHVFTALEILNLPRNAHDYYMKLPRRHDVQVIDRDGQSSLTNEENALSFDEAEALLRQPVYKPWVTRQKTDDDVKFEYESNDSMSSEVDAKMAMDSPTPAITDDAEESDLDEFSSDEGHDTSSSSESTNGSLNVKAESGNDDDVELPTSATPEAVPESSKAGTDDNLDGSDSDASSAQSLSRQELLSAREAMFDDSWQPASTSVLNRQLDVVRELIDDEIAEEDYLEAQDQYESAHERLVLWKTVGQLEIPPNVNETLAAAAAEAEKQHEAYETCLLNASDDLVELTEPAGDWRDHTNYVEPWEQIRKSPQSDNEVQ